MFTTFEALKGCVFLLPAQRCLLRVDIGGKANIDADAYSDADGDAGDLNRNFFPILFFILYICLCIFSFTFLLGFTLYL